MEISEPQKKDGVLGVELISVLLELSAIDDLTGFKHAVEKEGRDVDEASLWYGRIIGCKKMGFVERTPLMVAAMFGSMDVLNYILQTRRVDVNRACGSDGATALHCAAASGSTCSHEVVRLLVDSSADISSADAQGNQPVDLIAPCLDSSSKSIKKSLEATLKGAGGIEVAFFKSNQEGLVPRVLNDVNSTEKKEYPVDPSIPDIKTGIYGTDEFRMYTFKVKPCSRAYSHDWTECPFVHPGKMPGVVILGSITIAVSRALSSARGRATREMRVSMHTVFLNLGCTLHSIALVFARMRQIARGGCVSLLISLKSFAPCTLRLALLCLLRGHFHPALLHLTFHRLVLSCSGLPHC
ncbi:hypothetical protein Nepgr_000187 [Nepenthes gracilis]|uniref:AtC3H23-like CCCH zinc finger domain-containing protein n=1 Tax=Nepenthes gracilis TaxID=150966 RepID=A0AAD3P368_NEPGR|nr:hypothetical protein Nepgr_000187 [Nepenthes gracilis]